MLIRPPLYLVAPSRHPLAARKTIAFDEVAGLSLVLPSDPHPLCTRLAKQRGVVLGEILEADSIRL